MGTLSPECVTAGKDLRGDRGPSAGAETLRSPLMKPLTGLGVRMGRAGPPDGVPCSRTHGSLVAKVLSWGGFIKGLIKYKDNFFFFFKRKQCLEKEPLIFGGWDGGRTPPSFYFLVFDFLKNILFI